MIRASITLLALLIGPQLICAEELPETAFAFGLPIVTQTAAAAYHLAVPSVVYQDTFREDLGDVRVFNGDGAVVACSLQRNSRSALPATAVELPLFPLPSGSRAVADGVHVTIESRGAGLELRTQSSDAPGATASQYILDGRTLASAVAEMRLDWPETDSAFSGHLQVEASDDLGTWHTIISDAPIANLRSGGQAIVQNQIVLPPTAARYWRLSWIGRIPAFSLSAVSMQPAEEVAPAERSSVEVTPTRDAGSPQDFYFDLASHAPVDRINLLLSEANTVATVQMSSRRHASDPWRAVVESRFFRLGDRSGGDHQNVPVEIVVNRDRYWRAHVTSDAGLPSTPFRLRAEWIPEEIIFLARGHGPFVLAYGNAAVTNIPSDLGHLPADIRVDPATVGTPFILGGRSRLSAPKPPLPRMRVALWSTLLVAVAALAWMAYRLSAEK